MAHFALNQAKKTKNDEFYTQLTDIQKELAHYKDQLKGKIIFCNCDDPYESNFFKYFAMNFNTLWLKRLIATCYIGSSIANKELSLFAHETSENKTTKVPHKIVINEVVDENNDTAIDLQDVIISLTNNKRNTLTRLNGNGDFRSAECIELLKEADIVVTNPPFSLFREYIAQLMEYKKKFLIIGNKNAITYKEIFKYIKENKLFTGYRAMTGGMWFTINADWENYDKVINWEKLKNVPSCWFTNLDVAKHHEFITLYKKYLFEEFPKYDNCDAIEVSKVVDIPMDYEWIMWVPITFIDKYNPEQFEILWLDDPTVERRWRWPDLNGKPIYRRIIIKRRK